MKKLFLLYGAVICLVFAFASFTGWDIFDSFSSESWGPQGPNVYHK